MPSTSGFSQAIPVFPARSRQARIRFWLVYWFWFFVLLPWMLLRQLGISAVDLWFAFRTSGRTWNFLNGRLRVGFVGCGELLITAGMFGERFTWLRWEGILIDPGPAGMRHTVQGHLQEQEPPVAVVCTHWHEEHLGNAAFFADHYGIPVFAAPTTLAALRTPPILPGGRHFLMGQAAQAVTTDLRRIGTTVGGLEVIPADGHCLDHLVLFAREDGVLFAGDAFLDEIFTSPNADTDHRAWISTLERLRELPIRTLVGAHGAIITCDPRLPRIAGVVRTGDPVVMIARKLEFLCWAMAVVHAGEISGQPASIMEATLFPWQKTWSWRTWFHDEGFRLLTCGEFSRTHLVRSLAKHPENIPGRFPAFLRLGRVLADLGPELLRIHLLAARPESVLVIAGSIVASAALLLMVAPPTPQDPGMALASAAVRLIDAGAWGRLLLVLAAWTWWWAVIGGAITRRMALAVHGDARESWATSLHWCLRPFLFLPSALASLCLLAVALAPTYPWWLIAMPPVWLVAGILYAGLCLPPGDLVSAGRALRGIARRPLPFLRRQALFLLGFLISTGVVYLLAGLWWAVMAIPGGGWFTSTTGWLCLPGMIFALGYTTANLKSLQIWLYLHRDRP